MAADNPTVLFHEMTITEQLFGRRFIFLSFFVLVSVIWKILILRNKKCVQGTGWNTKIQKVISVYSLLHSTVVHILLLKHGMLWGKWMTYLLVDNTLAF